MSGQNSRNALDRMLGSLDHALDRAVDSARPRPVVSDVGMVSAVGQGVAMVQGLPQVRNEEVLTFEGGGSGLVFNVDQKSVGVVLLEGAETLEAGQEARRTRQVLSVPVGEALLGRIVTPTGRALDGSPAPRTDTMLPVERPAPEIMDRAPVVEPLQTGLKVVDALIPIGRGQRELILGDRQTGKTAIALDAMLNQHDTGVISIYCAVGKRGSAVARVADTLRSHGAMDNCVVVSTTENDPPGLQFIAPYAAASMGEHFMARGRDVLLVLDDLTRHARAYRELSLLLRRPPGREAYPGDIFYVHSRLLERSTHLKDELGGGSMTALPIVETEAQNLSAYIPTNLISITDGQISLSPDLFGKGILPAVEVGTSVSRVGGKTQLAAYRAVAGDLKLSYSQFQEMEAFSRFGTQLDEETRNQLRRGRRVREVLKQPRFSPLGVAEQVAVLLAVNSGLLDDVAAEDVPRAEQRIREAVGSELTEIAGRIEAGEALADEDRRTIRETLQEALRSDPHFSEE